MAFLKNLRKGRIAGWLALTFLLPALPGMVSAETAKEYFKGKTITYIVATTPGGNYDTYARLISKYMKKYLPVSKIIVRNMPGAGHIIGANHIYSSRPNGLTIGTFNTGLIYAQLLKREGIRFDLRKMTFIGKAAADPRVVMVGVKTGVNSFADLQNSGKRIKFSASGVGSASYNESKMLVRLFNLPVDIIPGYSGRSGEMGILRGELHGELGSLSTYHSFLKSGYGRVILILASTHPRGYEKVPLATDVSDSADVKSIMALIASQSELARFTAGPPGLPEDRKALLIKAYRSALTDPGLLAHAKKIGKPIMPAYGDAVAKRVSMALNQSPQTLAIIKRIMSQKAPTKTVTAALSKVGKKGKKVVFKGADGKKVKAKISGSRTKITINGKKVKRKKLEAGLMCKIVYKPGGKNEPVTMDCVK